MKNSFFLILLVFVFGISKNIKAMNHVVHEKYKASILLVAPSVEAVFYENGKNNKHPNFSARFLKSNIISNQFR